MQGSRAYAHYARLPAASVKALHEAAARLPKPPPNGRPIAREGRSPEGVDREQRRQPAPKRQHPARAASLAVRARWEAQAQRAKQLQAEAEGRPPLQAAPKSAEQPPVPLTNDQPVAPGLQGTGPSDGPSNTQTLLQTSRPTLQTAAVRSAAPAQAASNPNSAVVQPGAQQRVSQVPPQQDGLQSSTISVGQAANSPEARAAPTAPAQ